MIQDDELRGLFKIESEEQLQRMDRGFLRLEADPTDRPALEDVFREAHSLKGAARMLGVRGLESIAHALEDLLGRARRSEVLLTPELIDDLCKAVDGMRLYVDEAITGRVPVVDLEQVMNRLSAPIPAVTSAVATAAPEPSPPPLPPSPATISLPPSPETPTPATLSLAPSSTPLPLEHEPSPSQAAPDRIDTLRVDLARLDALMALSAEIVASHSRMVNQPTIVERLQDLLEEAGRNQGTSHPALDQAREALNRLQHSLSEEVARMDVLSEQLDADVRGLRLVPLSTLYKAFPRMVRDLSREQAKPIDLSLEGGETSVDKSILEEMKAPLMHLLRNAIDHGLETPEVRTAAGKPAHGRLTIRGYQAGSQVILEVQDDGRGINPVEIRERLLSRGLMTGEELDRLTPVEIQGLVFSAGFSTREEVGTLSGRGVGLDVVRVHAERLRGSVELESTPGQGSLFRVRLPVTLLTRHLLVIQVGGETYGVPAEAVRASCFVPRSEIFTVEGQTTWFWEGKPIPIFWLASVLERPVSDRDDEAAALACVILEHGQDRAAFLVDAALEVSEVVAKPLGAFLTRVRNVSGVALVGGGAICLVLHPPDLLRSAWRQAGKPVLKIAAAPQARKTLVLLVEDSIVTRTQEKRILESAGYEVVVAVDGLDGIHKLATRAFDAVVSDVQMPVLDGLGLTARIRENPRFKDLPIILVTSLASDEDRQRGLEAGANAYIAKTTFDQKDLLDALKRLI